MVHTNFVEVSNFKDYSSFISWMPENLLIEKALQIKGKWQPWLFKIFVHQNILKIRVNFSGPWEHYGITYKCYARKPSLSKLYLTNLASSALTLPGAPLPLSSRGALYPNWKPRYLFLDCLFKKLTKFSVTYFGTAKVDLCQIRLEQFYLTFYVW